MEETSGFASQNAGSCQFYSKIVEGTADAVIAVGEDHKIAFFNAAAENLFGYEAEEVLGKPLEILLPQRFRDGHEDKVGGFRREGDQARYMGDRTAHTVGLRADGTEITLGTTILKIEKDGEQFAVAIARDITQRITMEEELRRMASSDPLTGTLNRRAVLKELDKEWSRARRYSSQLSLMLFDLDHFKHVNDSFGHDAGDAVIRRFCELADSQLRNIDIFGRWGGEEFIAVLPHADIRTARTVAERIRLEVERAAFADKSTNGLSVTVSVGVSESTHGCDSAAQLIKGADQALYEAKESGRNRVALWKGCGALRAVAG